MKLPLRHTSGIQQMSNYASTHVTGAKSVLKQLFKEKNARFLTAASVTYLDFMAASVLSLGHMRRGRDFSRKDLFNYNKIIGNVNFPILPGLPLVDFESP